MDIMIVRPELPTLSLAVLLLFISSAATMSMPWIVGKVMNFSQGGSIDDIQVLGFSIYQFFGACAAILTLGAAANFGRVILLRIIGEKVVARLRSQLFRKTYGQDAEFFDANRTGDLISRLSSDTIIVAKATTQNLSDGLRALVSGMTGLTLMVYISPSLTTIILYAAPLIGTSAFLYGRVVRKLSRDMQKNVGTLTKIAEERLGNVKTAQAFVGEQQEVRRYNKQVKKIFNLGKRQSIFDASFFSSSGWMGNMTLIALLWYSSGMVRSGTLTPGDLTTFMLYAGFAGSSLFGVSGFFSELMKGVGAADRLFELQDRKNGIPATTGIKVVSAQGPIKFDNVTFAYPTRPAVAIFNGLSFEIPSGSNVCIVGPSGGGKSTVSSLLLRFYNPTSGTISINGVDITKMNVKSLRRRIGMVSQEPVLFSGSVAENIAYGRPNASRAEIIQAAQRANCQFISDFPHGLETQVGARGAQLSGGQKQRIAIARALLKDPDILILDEATSALDAESETLVNAALAELLKGRNTTISIAHRLSTIKRSDQIIVLDNSGKVAEIGSYVELSANMSSAFNKLMEWQMSGGEIPEPQARRGPELEESEVLEEEIEEEEEEEGGEETGEKVEKTETPRK
ncbi:ATP-binding cassette permease mdl1 [Diatrype stigma]|uniref:ATP-binding cassette permease mdl1 n=1 Tax=Diatrype stigma TaxID=117547 RepID=A0AAN9V251_9PEZI